jgi:LysW-gamma-L-lysine carboxypeptidase
MQAMESNEPAKLLMQMLEFYSPSGHEENLARFLKDKLAELGFKNVRLDNVGNVLGEVGKGSPAILLCGHMDTVPGRLPVKIEGVRIYGRGAVDAKSSLAAMIMASSKLIGQQIRGKAIVAGVVDEEGKGRGILQLARNKLGVGYAVFGEPSGIDGITIGYKGRLLVKILCETKPGHVGAPRGFDNAINKAYELWSQIEAWASEKKKSSGSMFYSTTACLTGIRGGEASNVIPSKCTLIIDVRLPLSVNCQKGVGQLNAVIQQFKLKNQGVGLKMRIADRIEPFIADKDSALVKALTQAIEKTVKGPAKLLRKTGTGDMNIFATETNVPAVTYGPGDSKLSHTLNEYIEIEDYLASIEVYQKTVARLLTMDKGER